MANMSKQDKLDHIKKCEFHTGVKEGECPLISNKEAKELRKYSGSNKE